MSRIKSQAKAFCDRFELELPILLAPMAGACPAALSIAVMQAGGMGACGALLMPPQEMLAWANALGQTAPEDTRLTRAFSGRAGRSIATNYVLAAMAADAPPPAPYPVQRGLTAAMRAQAQQQGDVHRMQSWAGQSAALARSEPAAKVARELWQGAQELLS